VAPFQIRLAQPEDWPAICQVFANAGKAAWSHIFGEEALSRLIPPDRWRQILTFPYNRTAVFGACAEGEVKGFIVLRPSEDEDATVETGEVDSFYTDPSVWGLGAGQALMAEGIAFLRQTGFQTVTLWTETRNHRPRAFYEKSGWTLDGTVRQRPAKGFDIEELRYRKGLSC
jgi:GNAT superfamily N-acetyltransferase